MTDNKWHYIGDGNLQYGGTFIREEPDGHYFDVVEVVDLGSACGANDLYLVESGTTSHEYWNRHEILQALKSCGPGRAIYKLGASTRQYSRLTVAEALWNYGHKDIDTSTVLFDADNGSDCANCGEPIVYRNGQCEHFDPDNDGRVDVCGMVKPDTGETAYAEPPTPVRFENGAEGWPDMLDEDWKDYADGEPGIRRYLSNKFDISEDVK